MPADQDDKGIQDARVANQSGHNLEFVEMRMDHELPGEPAMTHSKQILAGSKGKLLVHGRSANRVGVIWPMRRILV